MDAHRACSRFAHSRRVRRITAVADPGAVMAAFLVSPDRLLDSRAARPTSSRGGAFEAWLIRTDAAMRVAVDAMPRWFAYLVEIGYLFCFPLIPIAFAVVWLAGSESEVARFWTAVLAAAYACYVTLPWLVSRPPRLIERGPADAAPTAVSRANVFVLGRVSHHLNTFPSGHVAVSVAAAISAGRVEPLAGVVLGVIAAGVALGAVAGRYHFIVDALLGVGLGVIASAG